MRSRRRTPAGGVQAEKQRRYVGLIATGVSNTEACRLVEINRKTGNRRYGRTVVNAVGEALHYPPVKITEPKQRSPRYLSEQERLVIADLLAAGSRSGGSRGSSHGRRRRSAVRSAATATSTAATGLITPSTLPGHGLASPPAPDRLRRRAGPDVASCWPSAGAPSGSLTNCADCSPGRGTAGCARRRSIRRSMTRWSRSRAPPADGVVAVGCWGCSAADGFWRCG